LRASEVPISGKPEIGGLAPKKALAALARDMIVA
jgi:hypothetical protein